MTNTPQHTTANRNASNVIIIQILCSMWLKVHVSCNIFRGATEIFFCTWDAFFKAIDPQPFHVFYYCHVLFYDLNTCICRTGRCTCARFIQRSSWKKTMHNLHRRDRCHWKKTSWRVSDWSAKMTNKVIKLFYYEFIITDVAVQIHS